MSKLFVLIVIWSYKFVFDWNSWYQITVQKNDYTNKKLQFKKKHATEIGKYIYDYNQTLTNEWNFDSE